MQIKYGCYRIVLLIGPWAIKVPNFRDGWSYFLKGLMANHQEKVYSTLGNWAPHLCPVIFGLRCGLILVMPRCQPIPLEPWPEFLDVPAAEEGPRARGNIIEYRGILVERKPDSFGLLKGQVVIVDYGDTMP